jgi:hypothetical protein
MIETLTQNRITFNSSEELSSLPFYFKSKTLRTRAMSAHTTPAVTLYLTCALLPYLLSVNLYGNIKVDIFN